MVVLVLRAVSIFMTGLVVYFFLVIAPFVYAILFSNDPPTGVDLQMGVGFAAIYAAVSLGAGIVAIATWTIAGRKKRDLKASG